MRDVNEGKAYLVDDLHENLADDPYGTAMYVIRRVLEDTLDDSVNTAMNEREFATLELLAQVLTMRDPAAAVNPRVG